MVSRRQVKTHGADAKASALLCCPKHSNHDAQWDREASMPGRASRQRYGASAGTPSTCNCASSCAIDVGPYSAVAVGDFLAGPSHELPTGGAGKAFPGLTADMFQRRTSVVRLDRQSVRASWPAVRAFARVEGLDAHGRSVECRTEE